MARYVIIEDERLAYEELKRMMLRLRPNFELAGWATSVEQAVLLLKSGEINLALVDIRLSDGLSFDIFEQIATDIPIIFTTAYDEYAIKAFKVNGVDYLLKPIEDDELERALDKFERQAIPGSKSPKLKDAEREYASGNIKSRFLIQVGDTFQYVATDDIAYFLSEDKYTYINLFSGKKCLIDYSLDQLESVLDKNMFFRVSRNCITSIKAVKRCTKYFGGRLKLYLSPEYSREILISRNRVAEFLKWIDGIVL